MTRVGRFLVLLIATCLAIGCALSPGTDLPSLGNGNEEPGWGAGGSSAGTGGATGSGAGPGFPSGGSGGGPGSPSGGSGGELPHDNTGGEAEDTLFGGMGGIH